ncbi:MAG: phosphatase PAP2 family protein [Bacteroidota bacterium]
MKFRILNNIIKSGLLPGFFYLTQTLTAQTTPGYQLKSGLDIGMALGSSATFATGLYFQHKEKPLPEATILLLDRKNVNRFDRIATYQWHPTAAKVSDGLAVGSVLMYSYFYFNKSTRSDFFQISTVGFQSVLLSQALANAIKPVGRYRPYLYNSNVPMEKKLTADAKMSFFSAHTATVSSACFSFAFAHQQYMPNSKANRYVWSAAVLVPAVQGYLRVKAGKHYPTDVITGYLVGLGSSFLMHQLHKRN